MCTVLVIGHSLELISFHPKLQRRRCEARRRVQKTVLCTWFLLSTVAAHEQRFSLAELVTNPQTLAHLSPFVMQLRLHSLTSLQ